MSRKPFGFVSTPLHMVLRDPFIQSKVFLKGGGDVGSSRFIASVCAACRKGCDVAAACLSDVLNVVNAHRRRLRETAYDVADLLTSSPVKPNSNNNSHNNTMDANLPPELVNLFHNLKDEDKSSLAGQLPLMLLCLQCASASWRRFIDSIIADRSPWAVFHEQAFFLKSSIYYLRVAEMMQPDNLNELREVITPELASRELVYFAAIVQILQEMSVEVLQSSLRLFLTSNFMICFLVIAFMLL